MAYKSLAFSQGWCRVLNKWEKYFTLYINFQVLWFVKHFFYQHVFLKIIFYATLCTVLCVVNNQCTNGIATFICIITTQLYPLPSLCVDTYVIYVKNYVHQKHVILLGFKWRIAFTRGALFQTKYSTSRTRNIEVVRPLFPIILLFPFGMDIKLLGVEDYSLTKIM